MHGTRVKVGHISTIEMYVKRAWYIERIYSRSSLHSLGLIMKRSIRAMWIYTIKLCKYES